MLSLGGPYKIVLRRLKFDRGRGVQQTQKLGPLRKSDNRLRVHIITVRTTGQCAFLHDLLVFFHVDGCIYHVEGQ